MSTGPADIYEVKRFQCHPLDTIENYRLEGNHWRELDRIEDDSRVSKKIEYDQRGCDRIGLHWTRF